MGFGQQQGSSLEFWVLLRRKLRQVSRAANPCSCQYIRSGERRGTLDLLRHNDRKLRRAVETRQIDCQLGSLNRFKRQRTPSRERAPAPETAREVVITAPTVPCWRGAAYSSILAQAKCCSLINLGFIACAATAGAYPLEIRRRLRYRPDGQEVNGIAGHSLSLVTRLFATISSCGSSYHLGWLVPAACGRV